MELHAFLIKCVDNFTYTSKILKAVFILSILIFVLQIIVISTMVWVEQNKEDGTASIQEGLWYHCDKDGHSTCCQTLENYLFYVNIETPSWMHGCRAFQIIGLLAGSLCFVLIFLCTSVEQTRANGTLKKACVGVNFSTSGILFISLLIYGSGYKHAKWLQSPFLAGSFGVGVFLGFCYFFQGVLIMVDISKSQSQINPQDNATENIPAEECVCSSREVFQIPVQESAQAGLPGFITEPSAPASSSTMRTLGVQGRSLSPTTDANTCEICMDRSIEAMLIPCGHNTFCVQCAETIKNGSRTCPFCRLPITDWNRVCR